MAVARHMELRALFFESSGSCESALLTQLIGGGGQQPDVRIENVEYGFGTDSSGGATVGYRTFETARGRMVLGVVCDHEHSTGAMVAVAAAADLAIIPADATGGISDIAYHHTSIANLAGIGRVLLVVDGMDGVGFDPAPFEEIQRTYLTFAEALGLKNVCVIPVSASSGDNISRQSERMAWYRGPSLRAYLDDISVDAPAEEPPLRMFVQEVQRNASDDCRVFGLIARGVLGRGDEVIVLPSARRATVSRIVSQDVEVDRAGEGEVVSLVIGGNAEVGVGDVVAATDDRPETADQVAAHVVWMGEEPMLPGRPYLIRCGGQTAGATISALKHVLGRNGLEEIAGTDLAAGEIGYCNLSFDKPLIFDSFDDCRPMGLFNLADRQSGRTIAVGMLRFGLWRATNVQWQALDISKRVRAEQKAQKPTCLWFTGLSGSGKSTVANLLEKKLYSMGRHTYILDGDNVRHGLSRDLGFTDADRVENIRRVSEVARLLVDAGLIVIVAFISPFRSERRMARALFDEGEFLEVFMDVPIEICERRDPKGLYKKARAGEIKNFTGIDSAYELPEQIDVHLKGADVPPEELVDQMLDTLRGKQII